MLYAGRLIGLKAIHLGLSAVAFARGREVQVEFYIVGDGPERERLRRQATALKIDDIVRWTSTMPQSELFATYRNVDAVLFPSLHDSSGNVVMEALSFALPVVCLDLGGPADIVTDESGCVIRTEGKTEDEVIEALGQAIVLLSRTPGLYERLSEGALARSAQLSWDAQMSRIKTLALACADHVRTYKDDTVVDHGGGDCSVEDPVGTK